MTELFFSDQTRVHFALARTEGLCGPVRWPDFAALWHEGRLGPLQQPEPFPDDLLLSLDLALGSIRGDPLSDERRAALRACAYCGDRWAEEVGPAEVEEDFARRWREKVRAHGRFLALAEAGTPMRIWYGQDPYSLCGFHYAVWVLRRYGCPIVTAALPAVDPFGPSVPLRGWDQLEWRDVPRYLARVEAPLSDARTDQIARTWERLRAEDAPLRAAVDGRLVSCPADHYDAMLLAELGGGPLSIATLIIHLWRRHPNAHGNEVLGPRVEELLRAGKLRLVHRSQEHFFDCVVALPDGAEGEPQPPPPPVPDASTPSARPNCVVFTCHCK